MPDRLTTAHTRELAALRARTIRELHKVWPLFDPDRYGTWDDFNAAASGIVHRDRDLAWAAGANYYLALRAARIGSEGFTIPDRLPLDQAQLDASLMATGLAATFAALKAGFPKRAALNQGFARMSLAAARHVANGSRQAIAATTEADPTAAGYRRITAGTCDFCEELAAAGTHPSADFPAHDGCLCTAEPEFKRSASTYQPLSERDAGRVFKRADDLPPDLAANVEQYSGAGYEETNYVLREVGGDLSKLDAANLREVKRLDEAMKAATASTRDVTVYRGIDFWPDGVGPGDFLTDDAFVSTSLYPAVAKSFAGLSGTAPNLEAMLLRIEVPAGEKALFISTGEAEVLLARGTRFEIVSVDLKAREVVLRVATKAAK